MNITAKICQDIDFVKHVIHSIWDATAEDGADKELWEPDPNDAWVEFEVDGKRLGVYRLHSFTNTTLQVCANILPEYRRKYTFDVTNVFHQWLDANCSENITRFIAMIPDCFPNVISYANKSGWPTQSRLEDMFTKNGERYGMVFVGITREELRGLVCQQQ